MLHWRSMVERDVELVCAIAARVHPGFFEDYAVFAERLRLAPEGCWIFDGADGALGYVLSHPWTLKAPPALNSLLGVLPDAPDTFYIHDLALLPNARGTGAARQIVEILIGAAQPFPTMSLVAVNGSVPFWSRFGFAVADRPELAPKLESYAADARLMVRQRV